MEGNPGRRLGTPRPRMCAVEAQRCVDLSARCCTQCLHAQRLSGRFSTPTFLDQMRPCGRSTYLSTTTTETLADPPSGSDWRMGRLLNLGRTVLGPNYGQRARRSSPGLAPDPARRRLADIA